jgi:hypothetical protein
MRWVNARWNTTLVSLQVFCDCTGGHTGLCMIDVLQRMPSSGMLGSVALVRTDVSEERIASVIRVIRIGEIATLAVSSNRSTFHFFAAFFGC